ncbi:hypothetical protein BD311DRAFT_679288, partial [Dichomitus squalens]
MCLKFGPHHQGRLFFPRLYGGSRATPAIPEEFFAKVYDHAILPTLRQCAPHHAKAWPHSYHHVKTFARGERGQFTAVSRLLPIEVMDDFAEGLFAKLDTLGPTFKDAFFELEAKGVKATSMHPPQDAEARAEALQSVLAPLDMAMVPIEEKRTRWFVDVALEIHREGFVMQWLTVAHERLLRVALPSLGDEQVRAVRRSKAFREDLSGHLTDFAGFRVEPSQHGRRDHATYVNVYTTDKAATYQAGFNGIYRRRPFSDLVPKRLAKLIEDVDVISGTFYDCGGGAGMVQDGGARMEIRVNLAYAEASLRDIPDAIVQHAVLPVPSEIWWSFKFFRMTALWRVFKALSVTPPPAMAWNQTIMMAAIALYMYNAVIYRPSE